MSVYVGWVPTITGRLSFSRFGDTAKGRSQFVNRTRSESGFVFGIQTRSSRDGAYPVWLRRLLNQFPDTEYLVFLRVAPGELPYPREACADAEEGAPSVQLRPDSRAELVGDVFLINGWKAAGRDRVEKVLDSVRQCLTDSMKLSDHQNGDQEGDQSEARNLYETAFQKVELLWAELAEACVNKEYTPNFARATVRLSRTGQCRVTVNGHDLFTTQKIVDNKIAAHFSSGDASASSEYEAEKASVAEQVFFLTRDLSHKHYHHRDDADLLTTVFDWTPDTDEHWRRETQYGLLRLAIAVRREDKAEHFREALGIIAYADAFQRHMCGWHTDKDRVVRDSSLKFAYDFSALKSSIEASLKARELSDGNRKARLLFGFATIVTTLSLMAPGLRIDEEDAGIQRTFARYILDYAVSNPLLALFAAALFALIFDMVALRMSRNPRWLDQFGGSLSRLATATMSERRRQHTATASHRTALILIGVFVLISGAAMVLLFVAAHSVLQWGR